MPALRGLARRVPRGPATLYAVLGAAAIVAIVFGLNSVYGFLDTSSASSSSQRTATVAFGTVQSSVTASGNVSVATSASANFGTSGTLTAVRVAVGDHVKAGQVLARIDPTTASSAVQVAEANLAQAESTLAAAEAGPTAAQKASNDSSLQQADSELTSAREQLATDAEAVSAAKKQLAVDKALGCPAAGATSSTSASSAASNSSQSSSSSLGSSSGSNGTSSLSQGSSAAGSGLGTGTGNRNTVDVRAESAAGPTGASGPSGAGGATGASGATGATGATGTTGATGSSGSSSAATGATGSSGASGSAATSTSGGGSSQTQAKSAPAVVTGQASGVGSATATLSGTVNPAGSDTTYEFEYGTSAASLGSKTAKVGAGSGSLSVSVTANLTGLEPGRTYFFRIVATSTAGTADGAEETLTTLTISKPDATTGSASSVLTKTATLNGTVTPNGGDTTYRFEYGTTTAYGRETPVEDAGSGTAATQVSAAVSGLKPDTAYLFRLVATNGSGTSTGIGEVVKTSASSCVQDVSTIATVEQTEAAQKTTIVSAESNLTQTQATIATSETPSAAAIAQDKAAVTQAEVTLASDRQALAETTLRAPVSGTVTAVDAAVGDTVGGSGSSVSRGAANSSSSSSSSQGLGAANGSGSTSSASSSSSSSTFATIETLDKLEVVSGFAEADATRLAVGQPATITFPALTNVEVAGKVVAVSSTSTVVSNVVTYDATIALVAPPSTVLDGMTANVAVVTQTRSHVLELPSSAITTNGTASTVELLANGKTTVTPIRTGLVGDSSTEIASGLQNGDVVVVPTVSIAATATSTTGTGTGLGGGTFGGGAGFGGGTGFGRGG